MRECNVILIDDRPNIASSSTIKNILRRANDNHQLKINLFPLNPKEERFVDEDGNIVLARLVEILDTDGYLKQSIQLIACDYDFGGDKINGFEIIRELRNTLHSKKKVILYSSNIEDVIGKILEGDKAEVTDKIVDLVSSSISSFCKKDNQLEEAMIKHLNAEGQFSADKAIEAELYRYKDYRFKNTYDKFENKTLGEIADFIAKHKHEGDLLKQEIVQQLIAYMIMMDNE